MKKIDAVNMLMNVTDEEIKVMSLDQVRDILGALRYATRQFEREVVKREMAAGQFMKARF